MWQSSAYMQALVLEFIPYSFARSKDIIARHSPTKIRHKRPPSPLVDTSPDPYQVPRQTSQRSNVDCGFNRASEAEEERHPDQVQAELDGVESGALLGESNVLWYDGVGSGGVCTVSGVAHETVEQCPCRTEDPWWWSTWAVSHVC